MKSYSLIFLLTFFIILNNNLLNAQFLKSLGDMAKEKATTVLKNANAEEATITLAVKALEKAYAKKDSTSMSMAMSSYDNVSFYSDRKATAIALRYTTSLLAEISDYDYEQRAEDTETFQSYGSLLGKKKSTTSSYDNLSEEAYQLLKQAETLNQTGELSYLSRYFKYAESSFLSAEKYLSEEPNLESSMLNAKVKSNLGMLYHSLADFRDAETYFDLAYEILNSLPDADYQKAVTLNNQSILLKDLGQFNESENKLKEALKIVGNEENAEGAGSIMQNNLAILYQYLGRLDESIALLEEIIENNEANWNQKSNTFQRININLALIYENAGQYEEAEKIYLDALKLKERQNRTKQPDYAAIATNLSSLYLNTNQLDKDIANLLKTAEAIYRKEYGDQHQTVSSVLKIKGLYQLAADQKEEGLQSLDDNLNLVISIYGEDHTRVNESRILLAYAKWLNGDFAGASAAFTTSLEKNIAYIQNYFPAMSEVEKSKYWQTLQSDFQTYYAFVAEQPDMMRIKSLMEYEVVVKGLLLSTSGKIRKQILASNDQDLIAKYESWKSTKTLLAYYFSLSVEERETQSVSLDSLSEVSNDQEKWLSTNSAIFSSSNQGSKVAFQELLDILEPDEALVDIIKYYNPKSGKNQYAAAIVTSQGAEMVQLADEVDLDGTAVKLYKNSIIYKQQESKSYNSYWKAVTAKINGKKKLYVVKDGVYNQISLGSLYDGANYLSDKYDFSVLTNPGELLEVKKQANKFSSIFLMGSPAFDLSKYSALPGTGEEIKNIEKMAKAKGLKVATYLESNASESNFENSAEFGVLHVATHGFFVDKKVEKKKLSGQQITSGDALESLMRSGLVLAEETSATSGDISQLEDGLATAYEISSLDFKNTEMVVLSACETGLGEIHTGEGVYGLQRSFLIAGAKSVIMSLWKVDDAATRDFMVAFYKQWLSTGNKYGAFNYAKRQVKSKYPEPYYWGAFVLIEG